MNEQDTPPATPSADEEIERIAEKHCGSNYELGSEAASNKANVIAALKEYRDSHANEREEWIKRAEEWRINAEEKRNHLKTAEVALAAREGEIERLKEKVANQAKVWSTELSALQAELATAQKTIEELKVQRENLHKNFDQLREIAELFTHCAVCGEEVGEDDSGYWYHRHRSGGPRRHDHEPEPRPSREWLEKEADQTATLRTQLQTAMEERDAEIRSLRSQLTEAQAEKERIRGQLISHEHMAASGVYVETEKYAAMVAQLTEAHAKLAECVKVFGEVLELPMYPTETEEEDGLSRVKESEVKAVATNICNLLETLPKL